MTINGLPAKLIARKGKKAEIEIEGQSLIISSEYLPPDIDADGAFELYPSTCQDGALKEKNLAKEILEEILNGK